MRIPLLVFAILLAGCETDRSDPKVGGSEPSAADPAGAAGNLDRPVSSDDDPPPPQPQADRPTSDCPISESSNWHAHVDAMPGPNRRPSLIVTGKVTVPTGGYSLALRLGAVAESYPVQVTVHLDATPPTGPATQAIETREVRGSWPSEQRVGSVTVRCGRRVLARIDKIETAL